MLVAELAVAIAGFSSVVVKGRGRTGIGSLNILRAMSDDLAGLFRAPASAVSLPL